jgi:hypothetical protein
MVFKSKGEGVSGVLRMIVENSNKLWKALVGGGYEGLQVIRGLVVGGNCGRERKLMGNQGSGGKLRTKTVGSAGILGAFFGFICGLCSTWNIGRGNE